MSHLMDRVSYLRGLMDGMKLDTETNEGRLLSQVVDVLESMACEISELSDQQEELSDYVDDIDQDLNDMEELVYGEDDDEDDEEDEEVDEDEIEDCDGDCEGCSGCDDYDGDILVECMCPQCQGTFYAKEEELSDDAFHICPRCGARIHVVPDYEDDIPVAALADVEDKDE